MDRLTHFRPSLPLPLLLALFLTSAATVIAGPSDDDKEQSPRPLNVVFILADDLGFQELGCFGQQKIRTPHLDQLAAHGMKLTQHYSGNAVCAPSRCVLMTGKHPGHAWIRNNSEAQPEGQRPIPASEVTLAEVLKARGYVTGAFGNGGSGDPALKVIRSDRASTSSSATTVSDTPTATIRTTSGRTPNASR